MDNITYRKLNPEEAEKYRQLRLESLQKYPNSFGSTYAEQMQRAKLSFEKFIEESNPECIIIGALQHDRLIGICGFYRQQDERTKHRGEIIQLYVQPEYQGDNVGYNLLKTTVAIGFKIEELEQIELEVMTDVKAANRIYEKIGFKECGVQKHFYKKAGNYFDQRLMILFRNNTQDSET